MSMTTCPKCAHETLLKTTFKAPDGTPNVDIQLVCCNLKCNYLQVVRRVSVYAQLERQNRLVEQLRSKLKRCLQIGDALREGMRAELIKRGMPIDETRDLVRAITLPYAPKPRLGIAEGDNDTL